MGSTVKIFLFVSLLALAFPLVPAERPYVEPVEPPEVFTYIPSSKRAAIVEPAIEFNIPVPLAWAQCLKESSGDPLAIGKKHEIGGYQHHPLFVIEHLNKYLPGWTSWNPFDLRDSARLACAMLRAYYEQTGRWSDALAMYNAGREGASEGKGRGYAEDIMTNWRILECQI